MTLYYEKFGKNKKTILILPGWGDTRKTFDYLIENLKQEHTIYIFDYPGFGKSIFPNKDITIYDYEEYFKDFIQEKKLTNLTIIGHSFGGRIAILLTSIDKIKVKNIILMDAAGIKPKKTWKQYLRQTLYKTLKKVRYLLPKNIKKHYQRWLLKKFSSADYQALPPEMMTTFRNVVNEDLRKYLPNIHTEVLLIWGENDIDTPLADGKIMEKEIKEAALITIHHATHYCYLEQPLLILRIIKQFLQEQTLK